MLIYCKLHFADVGEMEKKTMEGLNSINTEEFQKCFQQ